MQISHSTIFMNSLMPAIVWGILFSTVLLAETPDNSSLVTAICSPVFVCNDFGTHATKWELSQSVQIPIPANIVEGIDQDQCNLNLQPKQALPNSGMPSSSAYNHFDLHEMRKRVRNLNLPSADRASVERLPKLLQLSDGRLAQAWSELTSLISNLEPSQRQEEWAAELFFARGQVWSAAGNHSDALRDFMTAASIVRSQKHPNLIEHARYFTALELTLNQEVRKPGSPTIGNARTYWGEGLNQYRKREYDKAVIEFTDAIQLEPDQALYWYSRALTFRALNLEEEAEADARRGVNVEFPTQPRRSHRSYYREMEQFASFDRIWLETFRRGSGASWGRY